MLFLETPGGGDLLNFVRVRRRINLRTGGYIKDPNGYTVELYAD